MTDTAPEISVVVPTYQRAQQLGDAVGALLDQDCPVPYEVVVVDDGSRDATQAVLAQLREADGRVRVESNRINRGAPAARNRGWRAARAPVVAFTDDDCIAEPGWLGALHAAVTGGADVAVGRTVPPPGALEEAGPFSHWLSVTGPMPWFPTCNIAYRRGLLAQLDGFDETFTAAVGASFGDDTDLAWRALEAGADARFVPGATVEHAVTASDLGTYLRARRRRAGIPEVVARHPGLRTQLPRWWAYRESHPLALVAAAGLAAVAARPGSRLAWVAAAAGLAPYVHHRRFGSGRRVAPGSTALPAIAGLLVGDLLETAVVVRGAIRSRIWLL